MLNHLWYSHDYYEDDIYPWRGKLNKYRQQLLKAWENFIAPKAKDSWQSIPISYSGHFFLFQLCDKGAIFLKDFTHHDLIYKRSWLIWFKQYCYLDVGKEAVNSSYHVLYYFPTNIADTQSFVDSILNILNRPELNNEWWKPAGIERET